MKLIRYDDWQTGVVVSEDTFVDVTAGLAVLAHRQQAAADVLARFFVGHNASDWGPIINSWGAIREPLSELMDAALSSDGGPHSALRPLTEVKMRAPLPSPNARIFALGANFADHASTVLTKLLGRTVTEEHIRAEREQHLPPFGYTVIPQTVSGTGDQLVPPPDATMVDYEAEVAVVLRQGGRHLTADDLDVWGFTGFNDFSMRDHFFGRGERVDRGMLTWALTKNFQTANFCGPVMAVDEPYNVHRLRLQSRVNGETRQDSSTEQMVYSFGDVVAHLSKYLELLPGDMLVSGTPAGAAVEGGAEGPYLAPHDEVEVEVEGVGVLRAVVSACSGPAATR